MAIKASQPIGIFDSGIGGLTVAHAVKEALPNESLIYFGDIAHLPYGDKSAAAIQAYSVKITDVLLKHNCKLILIACNSASAAAFELVKEYTGSRAKVFNVIDPVVDYVRETYQNEKIGLIGTKQTVSSNVYKKKIDDLGQGVELASLATPLLVPMIEEGYFKNEIITKIIDEYLSSPVIQEIKSLILGCTHYPLIKKQVNDYYQGTVDVLDSSVIVAKSVKAFLEYHNLQNKETTPTYKFLVSDYTESFEASAKMFFHEEVHLEKYPLWE
jgi:glutamate racemase